MENKVYDVAIIGAGVVGVSIFNDLVRSGYSTVLLEKEMDVSTGTTKANSGIIHAGFDAKPGTMKAKLNVEGNRLFPSICKRINVPLNKCGAYVIGNDSKVVDELIARAKLNKVDNVFKLNRSELLERIPNITDEVTCGLFAENSYIVEPYFYTICLAEEAVINGGKIIFEYDLKKVSKKNGVFVLNNGKTKVFAKKIVNASGFAYNSVAKILKTEKYPIEYRRGEYFVLDHSERNFVTSTIFPLPTRESKGVLVTPTVGGNILVGPTSYISNVSVCTTNEGLKDIANKSSKMLKNINLGKTIRIFAGVRSVVGDDFIIEKSKKNDGVINICGICSPGLSAAPAISQFVISLLDMVYYPSKNCVKLKPYTRLQDLSLRQKNALIKSDSDYGKIVCKCEGITLGEIKAAINRPIRPKTMDGIKRRIRAGMGRCQGGFCNDKVAMIIAKENNLLLEDVSKEKTKGKYIVGNTISRGEK